MMKPLITLALCLAAYSGMGQMKFETYYGNMAGWGSTTDVGISYNNESGYFFTTRIAYIQAFGIAEDSDKISVALGTGKDWFLTEHLYTGAQLDLRLADKNLQDVGLGIIAPSIYLGYAWNVASYQIQLGLPYLLGFQAKFSLDN